MIIHALARRRRYLLTLVAIAISILYSLPVFASSARQFGLGVSSAIPAIVAQKTTSAIPKEQKVSLFQQLDLTAQQQQQIKEIHLRYQQQVLKKKQRISRLQQKLSDMMVGTEDAKLLRAKNRKLSILRQEMGTLRFESMLATREILTLEQRQKFRELVKDFDDLQ